MADEEVKIIAGDLMVSYNMCGTKNKFYNKIIVILFCFIDSLKITMLQWHSPRGISSLTFTIFDPNIFLIFSKSIFFHISPTSPKKSIMGKLLDFALKIAHRGNTGSHRGNVKKRYRVPNASSGKCWQKCVEKMANM